MKHNAGVQTELDAAEIEQSEIEKLPKEQDVKYKSDEPFLANRARNLEQARNRLQQREAAAEAAKAAANEYETEQ